MNSLNRIMSYDKTKIKNQENCNCKECISVKNTELENQIEYPKLSEEEVEQIISERYSDKDEKTKKFIRESLRVHGDKYDYSNVIFIKNREKVEIICRVEGHEPFSQTPDNHKQGHGCKLCGIKLAHDKTKMTLEEFIERARKIHGDEYDYSKVNYIDIKTEVIIICSKHGDFKQTPNDHLNGHGCRKCQYEKLADLFKLTLEEFIEKANKVHGVGRYDYSKVKYINYNTNVIIICNKHETPYEFPQTPNTHLSGEGCPLCGGTKKSTTEEFIINARKIHRDFYDYSKVNYVNNQTEVIIICPKHGDFKQTPNCHLDGQGCRMCGIEKLSEIKKLTTEEFIKKANEIHGVGTYDYSKVNYVDIFTEVIIICPIHSDFKQKPRDHLSGCGCQKCGGNKKLTTEEFIERANEIQGEGTYDYSKVNYVNMNTEVIIICPKHGEFPQTPLNHLSGCGCSLCNKKSKGETKVRIFLEKNNIKFEREKRFKDCRNILPLPFDFYLPQYNLCIEFDGEQHFIPHDFNSKETEEKKLENLKIVQFRDRIKNDYCKNNGINLLRIKYDENVEEKLTEYFQNNNIIKD